MADYMSPDNSQPTAAPAGAPAPTPPSQTPFPPAPSTSPAPMSPPPVSPPKKTMKIAIVAGVIVALLAIAGIVLYMLFFSVSKEDYSQATKLGDTAMSDASSTYSALLDVSYIQQSATTTENTNNIDEVKTQLANYKKSLASLSEAKALRNGDVKKAYNTYHKKANELVAFGDNYVSSAEKVFPAVVACRDAASSSSQGASSVTAIKNILKPCKDALEDAKDVPDADLKAFTEAYITNVDEVYDLIDQLAAAAASSNLTRYNQVRTELTASDEKLQDAQKDANSNIEKRLKAVNTREAYTAFDDVLAKKRQ